MKLTGMFSQLVTLLPTYENRTGKNEAENLDAHGFVMQTHTSAESLIKIFGLLFKVLAVSKKGSVTLNKR